MSRKNDSLIVHFFGKIFYFLLHFKHMKWLSFIFQSLNSANQTRPWWSKFVITSSSQIDLIFSFSIKPIDYKAFYVVFYKSKRRKVESYIINGLFSIKPNEFDIFILPSSQLVIKRSTLFCTNWNHLKLN